MATGEGSGLSELNSAQEHPHTGHQQSQEGAGRRAQNQFFGGSQVGGSSDQAPPPKIPLLSSPNKLANSNATCHNKKSSKQHLGVA